MTGKGLIALIYIPKCKPKYAFIWPEMIVIIRKYTTMIINATFNENILIYLLLYFHIIYSLCNDIKSL